MLRSITIPERVTSIGNSAFYGCNSLRNITIPAGVTNISSDAFSFCFALTGAYFMGNAPTASGDLFIADTNLVYYRPGTKGWGRNFAGLPTMPWNPQVLTSDASFGVRNNLFGFNIIGTANIPFVVEATPSLASPDWSPLLTLTPTVGQVYFSDSQWTNYSRRFYRLRPP
jgi:hypothetical protein